MKKMLFVVLVFLVIILSGCGKKSALIGTWDYYSDNSVRKDIGYVFEKKNTGKYIFFNNEQKITYEDNGKTVKIKYGKTTNEFEYKIDKDILTITDVGGNITKYKKR